METSTEMQFKYNFVLPDGSKKDFHINIDKQSLTIIRPYNKFLPAWTRMTDFKCPHCPLKEEDYEHCPVAVNLVDVIEEFKDCNSYDKSQVTVETSNRNYSKFTSLQSAVSSLLGIIMVTSGCPILGRLKPMLHFHLPFASLEETEVKVFSMYLLAQYLKWKQGEAPDWEMNNLSDIYEDIRKLNLNVAKRIADLESKDTSINSIIVLNNFADFVSFTLDEKTVNELEYLLKEFM